MTDYQGRAAFSPEDSVILASPTIVLTTGTHNLFNVPRYHFLFDVWAQVTVASGAAVEVTVGMTSPTQTWAAAFMDNITVAPTVVGCKRSLKSVVNTMAEGYWLTEDIMITMTVALNTGTAGSIKLFTHYKYIS